MVRQQTPFRFTEREMDIAKGTDLPDLLTHLGYQVRRVGSYYTTREMDSLRIKERRTWRRYSNQTGGDAIAFLQEFCGKDFREAVNYLLEFNGHRARASPVPHQPSPAKKERPAFALPSAAPDQRHVFAYLRKRGIAPQVIQSFIQAGLAWALSNGQTHISCRYAFIHAEFHQTFTKLRLFHAVFHLFSD